MFIWAYFWNFICNRFRRLFYPFLLHRSSQRYRRLRGNVRRLTHDVVVKEGFTEPLKLEAEAMRFAKANTTIPIPEVYDFQESSSPGRSRLFIQFMEGEMLGRVWRATTPAQKRTAMQQLGRYVQQLRSISQPRPAGWIGSIRRTAGFDMRIGSQSFGPFNDECAYNDWRISTFNQFVRMHKPTARRLQDIRHEMRDSHRVYFTHGDISRFNVLVKIHGQGDEDIEVTALLDWEQAGWRPEFWEAAKIVYGMESDWCDLALQEVVPGYESELRLEDELLLISGPPR